jgi:hypothetical protein
LFWIFLMLGFPRASENEVILIFLLFFEFIVFFVFYFGM